uniref:Amino acid transporter transmembrane domain-containing protein n=1 Tax=Phytophthora ramorum TaxID=164328 RepID=H3GU88_PHYRM
MAAIAPSSEPRRSAFFTLEDAKISFSIICCICGIGTLAMPSNFARAGPVYGTIAMLFMAFANIYATVALSRVILVAPSSVKTFSDVGEWVLGKTGRYLVNVSQLLVCLLLPCAFLVLGSTLLDVLFPDSFSQIFWIVFVAITAVPACLIPTLKAAATVAFIGCMGTIIADVVGVSVLVWEMRGHPTAPSPDVSLHQVLTAFGNLSLAYGVAVLIPDLQRQHSQPKRMPRVIAVSLGIGSAFFLAVAIAGYVAGGCQLSANLLFSIVNTSDPSSPSALGFTPDHGAVVMAYMFMHLHVVIVLSTVLQPPFYMAERLILGMHKDPVEKVSLQQDDNNEGWEELRDKLSTNGPVASISGRVGRDLESNDDSDNETLSNSAKREQEEKEHDEAQLSDYTGTTNVFRYVTLRLVIMAILVAASIGFRSHFLDLVDFTGASAITVCCLVLPLVFYLKVFWRDLPVYERVVALVVIVVCTVVGCYVMIYAGKNLFNPDSDSATFPYCSEEYQSEPYYVRNATTSA